MSEISIIVPVYKVEQHLERCVNSILDQSFADFELILVEDGSPDRCPQICDSFSQKDSRIHVVHQKNSGLSVARNVGIKYALRGASRWITFIDSDDWVHRDYLKRLHEAACSLNADVSICGFYKTDGAVIPANGYAAKPCSAETLWRKNTMNATVAWGKLYKKELFLKTRYPKGRYYEDEYVTYKLLFSVPKIVYDPAPLYYYFQNPNGIINSPWCLEKMHAIEALNLQIVYFRKHGYFSFAEIRWRFLCNLVQKHYKILAEKNVGSKERRWLRRHVRLAYKRNKNAYGLSMMQNSELYRIAYPGRLNFLRNFYAVFNRKKRMELDEIYSEQN